MSLSRAFTISQFVWYWVQILIIGLGDSGCSSKSVISGYLVSDNGVLWVVNPSRRYMVKSSDTSLRRYAGYYIDVEGRKHGEFLEVQRYQLNMDSARVRLKGRLIVVAGIGGETPGFALLLSSPFSFQGQVYKSFEVYSKKYQLEAWLERLVEAEGIIEWWEGVERGKYPVLHIEKLNEIHN